MNHYRDILLHLLARTYSTNELAFLNYTFDSAKGIVKTKKSNKRIIFTEEVMSKIINAELLVLGTSYEKGFFIYGKEISPNTILFFKTTDNEFPNIIITRRFTNADILYKKRTVTMSEDSLFEILDNSLDRELADHTKAIDSIMHFHAHNDTSINSSFFTLKDMFLYSNILPKINDGLDLIQSNHKLNIYAGIMYPHNNNVSFYTIESKINDLDELAFKMSIIPTYLITEDLKNVYRIYNNNFLDYYVEYDSNEDMNRYHIKDSEYGKHITDTELGNDILKKVKTYEKKTRW